MTDPPGSYRRWILAARPRTLAAAAVPVAVGAALVRPAPVNGLNVALCLVVALTLQVATNFANDFSDGVRGTDGQRVGPFRLTASGLVPPETVRAVALGTFAVASLAGLWLASRTSWWLVLIGASALLAGWFYTGGPKPYGYMGLGELFVFVYFGFVATVGTAYAAHGVILARAWWLGGAVGAMACALLEANNLRDEAGDRAVGKKTLAARVGRTRGGWLYVGCVAAVVVGAIGARQLLVAIAALAIYSPPVRYALSRRTGGELIVLLKYSARAQLLVGVLATFLLAGNFYLT